MGTSVQHKGSVKFTGLNTLNIGSLKISLVLRTFLNYSLRERILTEAYIHLCKRYFTQIHGCKRSGCISTIICTVKTYCESCCFIRLFLHYWTQIFKVNYTLFITFCNLPTPFERKFLWDFPEETPFTPFVPLKTSVFDFSLFGVFLTLVTFIWVFVHDGLLSCLVGTRGIQYSR